MTQEPSHAQKFLVFYSLIFVEFDEYEPVVAQYSLVVFENICGLSGDKEILRNDALAPSNIL